MVGGDSTGERWAERLLSVHNEARASAGQPAFGSHPTLDACAQERCDDMARDGYFGHTDPDNAPGNYGAVLAAHGVVAYRWAGENLAVNNYSDDVVARAMAAWLASALHRANILSADFDMVGGAAAVRPDGAMLMAVIFTGGATL